MGGRGKLSYNRRAGTRETTTESALPAGPLPSLASPSAWLQDLEQAITLLTRLPVARFWAHDGAGEPPSAARASRCYPLVGALVGLIASLALFAGAWLGLPALLAALLAVALAVLVTGALHEDGLADVADGFGGGRDRAAKLAIMRDSRIGSYGVIALVLSLSLRAGALAAIAEPAAAATALIAAQGLSRGGLATIMAVLPPARDDGLAARVGRPAGGDALAALAITMALAFLLLAGPWAVASLLALLVGQAALAVLARRQIGGYTGDVLGAAQQLGEVVVLVVLAAALTQA